MENEPVAGATRTTNPYILPGSILLAALIIGGSVIYMVNAGPGEPKKPINPLTLPYRGPTNDFSECIDSQKHLATAQNDYAVAGEAGVNSTPTTFVNGVKVVAKDQNGEPILGPSGGQSVGANGPAVIEAIRDAINNPIPEPKTGPFALTSRDVILGNADAPITVIEYGDYQCPFCERFHSRVYPIIVSDYVETGKVKFVYRDFPFLGQESLYAGAAAECAKDLGKFWEYHNALYVVKAEDAQKYQGGENDGFFSRDTLLNLWLRTQIYN